MAFLSKFGNILKQTPSKQLNGQVSLSSPLLFQAIRCMSSSMLFFRGMAYSMDEENLREAFSKYGEVVETRVILDPETGRSKGCGFVTFTSAKASSRAIKALDGRDLHGQVLKLCYAIDRTSGGGSGRGGYRGGYGSSGRGGYVGGAGGGYGVSAGRNGAGEGVSRFLDNLWKMNGKLDKRPLSSYGPLKKEQKNDRNSDGVAIVLSAFFDAYLKKHGKIG